MKKLQCLFLCIMCLTLWSGKINATVIAEIPPEGIVINAPGTYVFENNLIWNPSSDSVAILIEANDVLLDMQGFTLSSASSLFNTIGVLAVESANLRISNGTLQNMGLSGIKCELCSNVIIQEVVVDGLYLNETAIYTVPTGILATACAHVLIEACTVQNVDVQTGSTAAIQLTETLFSKVTNCRIYNLLNRDGACTGIGHLLCDDALVQACTLDTLRSTFINNLNTEGHTAIGLVPVLSTNLKFENCSISNVVGCCDDAHGVSIFLCDKAVVHQCRVSNVLDGAGPAQRGAKATGIEVYGNYVEVSDCFVNNISAINPEDKQATGFSCAQCTGVKFIRCKAENVNVFDAQGNQGSGLGYGIGFGWAPDPRPEFIFPAVDVLYCDCIAKECQVGFDSFFHINSVWDHVVSIDNEIPLLNVDHSQRTLACDPCSECGCQQVGCFPIPYVVTIENIAKNNQFWDMKIYQNLMKN